MAGLFILDHRRGWRGCLARGCLSMEEYSLERVLSRPNLTSCGFNPPSADHHAEKLPRGQAAGKAQSFDDLY